ncbi:MAG: ribosome silencing factor [Acidimicrobiales bacterium]
MRQTALENALIDPTEERRRSEAEIREHVGIAIEAAEDRKAVDTQAFFVGEVMGITDWFVVTSGSNPRQVRAIVENIESELTARYSIKPIRVEGLDSLAWVLMDFGGFVVHVFHQEARDYYKLERLWSDVPRYEQQPA